ncbi:MAG: von Willebrand factor type A domain protein [Chloroflexi bacterium ADurb.Bin120]|jgi:Ca-activated chloride channel family protein|uniref:VWFA domain-containing protein n=1 Tax=Candidatus Brevifilum fermentans TaxID=1986204 RepID=A0A1Y6K8A9_9CHLR|nr:VWA domain-containing protein [Brevefilum fermentans]OQB86068.1 MAG: von Willebrand factor type A domain protein [Chloroflexi bacterium ADurb.Bin120]SMX55118.1 protein of unknown function [Brevefilum fermentans]
MPLNLALVIDRSGSMHGEKLHFAKQAAAHVIDLLDQQDRAAIVIYDNEVEVLMQSQFLTEKVKHEAKAKIMGIQSRGSTFLYGGWLEGCRQIAETISKQSFNRTLLLTDGLANVGLRDVSAISMHAQELFSRNISTSCFGVGADYDEHMLEAIANHGGGNFHFLETVNAIPHVFEREFDEIISIVLKEVRVALTLPAHVEAKVSAGWRAEGNSGQFSIYLGSLVAEQKQRLYLRLSNLIGADEAPMHIPVKATGLDADQKEHTADAELVFKVVPESEEAAVKPDAELMERFAVVDLADQANEALKRERAGDRIGSAALMQEALSKHQDFVSDHTAEKYHLMTEELRFGYDALERKRRHYQEYQNKRGGQAIRDYQINFVAGVPLARIEGYSVFIDTAAPSSIAEFPDWLFMNEAFKIQGEDHGMTCSQLSQELGISVDMMLAMDILHHLHMRINPVQGLVQFSRQALRSSGMRLPVLTGETPPHVMLKIGKQDISMRLVTGLKFNYVPERFVVGLNQVSTVGDRLPGGEGFQTHLYKLPLPVGSRVLSLNCGVVPKSLRSALGLGENEGVLGADLLQSLPITLAFPDGEMILYI